MRGHTRLEVSFARLAHNWSLVQRLAPRARILPMVKADAYGHGLVPVGKFFAQELNAEALGVATLGEAEALAQALPEASSRIYVFSDTLVGEGAAHGRYHSRRILPVIADLVSLRVFLREQCFAHLPLTLKLNTGMNRLGVAADDWEAAVELVKSSGRRSVQHLLSHFACAAETIVPGDLTHQQARAFDRAMAMFRTAGVDVEESSLANSGAIEQRFRVDETWVRPGLVLYGPTSAGSPTQLASRLVTQVLHVFAVKRGDRVGYGGALVPEDGEIAVLPIGYGDGFVTQGSGFVWELAGVRAEVFGRVNMDMSFFYLTGDRAGRLGRGQEVELWGAQGHGQLSRWAQHCGTHSYQALCGLGRRIPRSYTGSAERA